MNQGHRLAIRLTSLGMWVACVFAGLDPAYSSSTASMNFSIIVRCDMSMAAVIPQTDYTIVIGRRGPSAPEQGCRSELNVTGDITADGRIDSHCSMDRNGIQIVHKTPAMKLTGMLCQPAAHAELQVTNNSAEGSGDVAVQAPGQAVHAADFLAREEPRALFGDGGTIRQTGIRDGEDYDHFLNGEITFGGTSPQTGGTTTVVNIPQRALDGDASAVPRIVFAFSAR